MLEQAKIRTQQLQSRMKDHGIQKAVFTDESSIAYLAGFWGYLGIEFGRPSMLVVDAGMMRRLLSRRLDQCGQTRLNYEKVPKSRGVSFKS